MVPSTHVYFHGGNIYSNNLFCTAAFFNKINFHINYIQVQCRLHLNVISLIKKLNSCLKINLWNTESLEKLFHPSGKNKSVQNMQKSLSQNGSIYKNWSLEGSFLVWENIVMFALLQRWSFLEKVGNVFFKKIKATW